MSWPGYLPGRRPSSSDVTRRSEGGTPMTITEAAPSQEVDSARWPDVATAPNSPGRAMLARRLFRHAVGRLPLRVVESGGPGYGGGTGTDPVMRLRPPTPVLARLGATRAPRLR